MLSMRRIIITAIIMGLSWPAIAAPVSGELPVLLEADEMNYDQQKGIVIAKGHVEIMQGEQIVLADSVTYNQNTNIVTATGNVSMLNPEGDVFFADSVELKDDMQEGVVKQLRARLADNSLFAANEGRKLNKSQTEMTKAVYSPCKLCEGQENPLWQFKADKVLFDQEQQRITYDNAFFEVYGVPVAYTPYLSHATPGADNKSGLLLPEYKQSSNLGTVVDAPVYIAIAPDKDMILTPIFTSEEGGVLAAEYRQLTDNGEFEFEGSATNPTRRDAQGNEIDGHEFRGHIRGKGNSRINEIMSWGFDVNRASDDTYLRKYDFGNEDLLTSRAYVEALDGRNYGSAQTLAFQGLAINDDPSQSPLILPLLDMELESEPLAFGSRAMLEGNALVLTRENGSESRRLSFTGGWKLPHVTKSGHIIEAEARLRTDAYTVDDLQLAGVAEPQDRTKARVIPQASLYWRYPMIKQMETASLIIEPIAGAVVSPTGSNSDEIPNEDSQRQEFSDTNLFAINRFSGYDLVETGPRVNYGVRGQMQWHDGKGVRFLFGQSYLADENNPFPTSSRPDEHLSDYVGRIGITYHPVDIAYRFQLDHKDLSIRRNEINSLFSLSPVTLSADYISLENGIFPDDKEEVALGGSLAFTENWTFFANGRRDLSEGGGMVSAGSGLSFQNECLRVDTGVNRTYIRDRDFEPETSFSVRVFLKNVN